MTIVKLHPELYPFEKKLRQAYNDLGELKMILYGKDILNNPNLKIEPIPEIDKLRKALDHLTYQLYHIDWKTPVQ